MIPKIIHYCWFGRNPKPRLIQKCIRSWSRYCPDYRVIEWTEDNFDLKTSPRYVQEAYAEQKWAFVADFVRFYALTKYGGIYLDTDMELLKPLTPFLNHAAFISTEDGYHLSAGIIGCVPDFKMFQDFMDYYRQRSFYNPDKSLDTTTVVMMITDYCLKKGYEPGNTYQEIMDMAIYPSEYFYPLSHIDDSMRKTENTVAIHWFAGSWVPKSERKAFKIMKFKRKIKFLIISLIGEKAFHKVKNLLSGNK